METLINKIKQNPFMAYAVTPRMAQMTGKQMETTYYNDFLVCTDDENAIRDTYRRARGLAEENETYGAELAMALNWLMWDFADYNDKIARVYNNLWVEWDSWVMSNYKGEMLNYYIRETD